METIYIYFFDAVYNSEHVDYMNGMLCCLDRAGELQELYSTDREDLDAREVEAKATPWAINFLEYMEECDMLTVTKKRKESDRK